MFIKTMESEGEVVRGVYMRQLQRLGAIGEFECRVCVCTYTSSQCQSLGQCYIEDWCKRVMHGPMWIRTRMSGKCANAEMTTMVLMTVKEAGLG